MSLRETRPQPGHGAAGLGCSRDPARACGCGAGIQPSLPWSQMLSSPAHGLRQGGPQGPGESQGRLDSQAPSPTLASGTWESGVGWGHGLQGSGQPRGSGCVARASSAGPYLVQGGALHQLEGCRVNLAVVEVHQLLQLLLLPLHDLGGREAVSAMDWGCPRAWLPALGAITEPDCQSNSPRVNRAQAAGRTWGNLCPRGALRGDPRSGLGACPVPGPALPQFLAPAHL